MRHGRYIYILGDVHGEFGGLDRFIDWEIRKNKTLTAIVPHWKADGDDFQVIILQCGDFAWFWPREREPRLRNNVSFLSTGIVPIYWTGGNHEDWDALDRLGSGISEIGKGVYFCPFGSTLEISPDVTVLFAGGAESVDVSERLDLMRKGAPKIWWDQEGISETDMDRLALVPKADWVISHTCPKGFDLASKIDIYHINEPSQKMLDRVFERYRPKRWFFGHFHQFAKGKYHGCEWMCLADMASGEQSWVKLYLEWYD